MGLEIDKCRSLFIASLFVLLCAIWFPSPTLLHLMSHSTTRVLLPRTIRPSLYHIHLVPDLLNFTFQGTESIEVQVLEETRTITIHALDIKVRLDCIFGLNDW